MIALKPTCLEAFRNANCGQKALGFLNKKRRRLLKKKNATREGRSFPCAGRNSLAMESSQGGGRSAGETGEPSGANTTERTERSDRQLPDGRGEGGILAKNLILVLEKPQPYFSGLTHTATSAHAHAHTARWPLSVSMCPGFNCFNHTGATSTLVLFFLSQPSTFTLSDTRERHNYPAKANVDAGLKGKHSREPTLLCVSLLSIKGHIACLGSGLQDSLRFAMGTVRNSAAMCVLFVKVCT